MEPRMVVFGIISYDDHAAAASRTDLPKVLEEHMECQSVELILLSLENELSVTQPDSTKVAYTLSCWMMQQHRVLLLRRYPHPAPRSVLLKMDFIGRPEIYPWICRELSEFFYIPPEPRDRLEQSKAAVCAAESLGT
jgi:hypothetical protein